MAEVSQLRVTNLAKVINAVVLESQEIPNGQVVVGTPERICVAVGVPGECV